MSLGRKIVLALLFVFIGIQFIQPARNKSGQVLPTDITKMYNLPENVQVVLKNACYDCHSNNTNYQWYATIQPVGWWLASHIKKGKADLNFNEFGNYSKRKQQSKLKAIANSVKDKTMPLPAYALIHKNAKLSKEDKILLLNWVENLKDSLSQEN
ncbi:cytochrome C [Solitalea longa]|uniref:Cytochrome C n=1 Tax=Solitalea longa TaxID=2079460 RepID=A0A2S5A2D0_9SPHI|nr:heme-binding domain-containing protein [Solitalea longa]POY36432.1 cytochrome C [Solitalea longa]